MHDHLLFIGNALAHLVASMSGLVSFAIAVYEATRKKKFETWAFFGLGAICLVVAFDQAWQDEHRNAQLLVSQKEEAVIERNFWKDQSYAKDAALHSRDELLAKNYSALIGEQTTANQTQQSIAQLSKKIIDTNAVCYRPDRRLTDEQRGFLFTQLNQVGLEMKKQHKNPIIIVASLACDRESDAFAQVLRDVFDHAGWTVKWVLSEEEIKNLKDQQQWFVQHGQFSGIVFLDSPATKNYGTFLYGIFSNQILNLAGGWPGYNIAGGPEPRELTMWVGYKVLNP
jgi:hypothetical protein